MDLIAKLAHEPSRKRDARFLTQYYEIEPLIRSHVEAYWRSHHRSDIPRSKEEQAKVAQAIRSRAWDIVDYELAEEQRKGLPKVSLYERSMRSTTSLEGSTRIRQSIPMSLLSAIGPRSDRPPRRDL